jgi:hypothetical protein
MWPFRRRRLLQPLSSFKRFLKERDPQFANIANIGVREGVEAILAFYASERAAGTIANDGDMLLYQWGTYDWGRGRHFELDITRQLILGEGEDDDIWQLSLTFLYEPSDELDAVGSGDRWCKSPAERHDLFRFITEGAAFGAIVDLAPKSVELDYECAG